MRFYRLDTVLCRVWLYVFLSLWGKMYHRWILRLYMKTEVILVCLFSLFSRTREIKGTRPLESCKVLWRWKDWVSGCIYIDIRKMFQLGVAFVTGGSCAVNCIFQAGKEKTSLMIRRHSRQWQNRDFKNSGTCSYNRVLTFSPQTNSFCLCREDSKVETSMPFV